jgi:hypothetical protein
MAQSLTVTAEKNPFMDANTPTRLILDWVSAVAGTVSLPIASTYTAAQVGKSANPPAPSKVQGVLLSTQTIPGYLGDLVTDCPTAYTLQLLDAYGEDHLNGVAVTTPRSATVSQILMQGSGKRVIDSELTLTIAGAGSGLKGRIILELEDMGYAKL